ncbi:MAG: glycerol-3-phosphate dehydrogenase [Deltaproteobacteria bacterium]|nr:glycerol-3-phosphate dehydrogenase [Deltaproteobacteria bacterium]
MSSEIFDIVICGGGITGAGIARDAAHRGLRVALIDKEDFGSGTSCRSSKLVHGGLRYLKQGELKLVFEGTSERALLMRRAPHLVRPIPFLVPIYKRHRPGLATVDIGLWVYDALAMFRSPKLHRTYRPKRVSAMEPMLTTDGLAGALEYYDCMTDDARLVLENVLDAKLLGAEVLSYTRLTGIERDGRGRIAAVRARDELSGNELSLRTHALVVAGGPWTDEILGRVGVSLGRTLLRPTKGVHVVVDAKRLPVTRAVTMFTRDQRVMFCLPWTERTVIGTTDTDFDGSPDEVAADLSDVSYICEHANRFFPDAKLTPDDVIATWAGLRPLIAPHEQARASDVSREHEIICSDGGVIAIAGGKLTTYRRMAKEAVDKAVEWLSDRADAPLDGRRIKPCRTKHRPLPGAQGLEHPGLKAVHAILARLRDHAHVEERVASHLAETYGQRAESLVVRAVGNRSLIERMDSELPYVWAEVEHAVDVDLAKTVEDVLVRRIPLCLRAKDQGLGVAEEVARRMARVLGWSEAERARQVEAYYRYVAATRRFRGSSS